MGESIVRSIAWDGSGVADVGSVESRCVSSLLPTEAALYWLQDPGLAAGELVRLDR